MLWIQNYNNLKKKLILIVFIISSCSLILIVTFQQPSSVTQRPTLSRYRNEKLDREKEELASEIEKLNPNLPMSYWLLADQSGKLKSTRRKICAAKFPNLFQLEYNNIYWQTQRTINATLQLYSAFYDRRRRPRVLRILTMIDRISPSSDLYCQMWLEGQPDKPVIVKVFDIRLIWYDKWGYKNDIYHPYLVTCKIPGRISEAPAAVSIVENPCDQATNALKVTYNKLPGTEKKTPFAVCVKGLDFLHEDMSSRLAEWIELLGLLGVEKIYFYSLHLEENATKVLRYYEHLGRVDVTPLTLPGGQVNSPGLQHLYIYKNSWQKRLNELLPYNDCFFRHMYEHEFIVLLDVDEVIMPIEDDTWFTLIHKIVYPMRTKRNGSFGRHTKAWYSVSHICFSKELTDSDGAIPK